ncbi:hypothetical protein CAPTEDRAFT_149978 [Capitella teleta]|uniref:Amino acid transporter transmembrane domain-containing protein n=1 Tax=Capitella teleta TaxID=283909 RepID=R7VA72_CAPTE|nr:hypothetical protein CAPTEDRAFT_149978 [Capitella teleta]|eukprot:ELU15514.1 hypothetical protein CAPTEDRAFT_149978 [Capitella teleta]
MEGDAIDDLVDSNATAPLIRNNSINRISQSERNAPSGVSPIVHEDDEAITIRRPLQYRSILRPNNSESELRGTYHRYRYYSRLDPQSYSSLMMPNHIVPPEFYLVIPIKPDEGTQSSIITIFSIWNTMMGTSLLSMPWALEQAGFGTGIGLIVLMGILTLYTAIRVLNSPKHIAEGSTPLEEFSDVCGHYLGRVGNYGSIAFSLVALLGAAIVYWVLMANFLFHTGQFIHDKVTHEFNATDPHPIGNSTNLDVYCPSWDHSVHPEHVDLLSEYWLLQNGPQDAESTFSVVWQQTLTVPFFLLLFIVPLINFKSPTFFTKFNALGTISVLYIISFIAYKASQWGWNMDFKTDVPSLVIPEFKWTFPALTGTLSLAFFIHNCVLSITRNQKNPQHNNRDVSIAYFCVAFTYLFIGVTFYTCFPLPKDCIEDNLLNNFRSSDALAFAARVFLFFQMITVFPLLMYIFRAQVLSVLFNNVYPGLIHVLVVNVAILTLCLLFAIFMPSIGTIIRFAGALCGAAYIFALPCIVFMMSKHRVGLLNAPIVITHVVIILIGVLNFIGQFLIM